MTDKLKREIKQSRPFNSVHEEVVLSMLRTADQLATPLTDLLRTENLSLSQYNVLRILRGAGDQALTCGDVSERMVRRDPDVTRLLDRLEERALISRTRDTKDRRVVLSTITKDGVRLLESLDQQVLATLKGTLSHMTTAKLRALAELLDEARGADESA